MLKLLKETMDKELKEIRRMVYQNKLGISRGRSYKKDPNGNSGTKKLLIAEKLTRGIQQQMWAVKERISKLEYRAVEIALSGVTDLALIFATDRWFFNCFLMKYLGLSNYEYHWIF